MMVLYGEGIFGIYTLSYFGTLSIVSVICLSSRLKVEVIVPCCMVMQSF